MMSIEIAKRKIAMAIDVRVVIYWGIGGQYGPFDEQKEGEWAGWPDFGQVMRYFRKKANLTAKEFGVLYGNAINADGSPVTERQILRMELQNQVPVDMNRRKLIARLLNVPPMLFGLAVLEDVVLQPHPLEANTIIATGQTTLQRVVADTTKYQNNIRTFWMLHDTSQAQSSLSQIIADIQDLSSLELQVRGDLLLHIQELLFSYHLIAAHIVRDQRKFSASHHHANEAVRVAKAMKDSDLIATGLYTRGCTYLEWGMFGFLKKGVFQVQRDKIELALRDLEQAKKVHGNKEKNIHEQLLGRIDLHISRAYAILNISKGEQVPGFAIAMLDGAEDKVEVASIDDPYTRVLVTGERVSFTKGGYHSARAAGFNAAKMPGAALKELKALEALQQGDGVGKDLTRRHVWLDIVAANAFMELGNFDEATKHAKNALAASQDINSITNLTNIVDIYGRLLRSPYKADADIEELGDMLRDTFTARLEQK
jgi:tetratricopeptide (TPR) repeat protein